MADVYFNESACIYGKTFIYILIYSIHSYAFMDMADVYFNWPIWLMCTYPSGYNRSGNFKML
jgi:hypothetical protein